MSYIPTGRHLIAGKWVSEKSTFNSKPASGPVHRFSTGTLEHVEDAVAAAEEAFNEYGLATRKKRADFLHTIADEIEKLAKQITEIGTSETGLPEARLENERGRTVGQIRLFAEHIIKGEYLDRRYDAALPERRPLPRPDLRMMQKPIGPVVIFGSANFPLAFSTAGGDTVSALAAGCPVIVKAHDAHPGTGEVIAKAISLAVKKCNIHPGVFSLIHAHTHEVGQALVLHPLVRAVGFTGSLGGGRSLFDLCNTRPEPIPFFGELGSVNPMYAFPNAIKNRGKDIAEGWAVSLVMGAGQFCTKPGIVIVMEGNETDKFIATVKSCLAKQNTQTMLTSSIAEAYRSGRDTMMKTDGVKVIVQSRCDSRAVTPDLLEVSGKDWLSNSNILSREVFGPLGLVIKVADINSMKTIASKLQGQITATLHIDDSDRYMAQQLMPILERSAGRILANGFPTGVEVCDSMIHGGPYPASTNFGATSVGSLSIRRWLRPICYQNIPESLLPQDLVREK